LFIEIQAMSKHFSIYQSFSFFGLEFSDSDILAESILAGHAIEVVRACQVGHMTASSLSTSSGAVPVQ